MFSKGKAYSPDTMSSKSKGYMPGNMNSKGKGKGAGNPSTPPMVSVKPTFKPDVPFIKQDCDKYAITQTTSEVGTLVFNNGAASQKQTLSLTTGSLSDSTKVCVSGTILAQGFEPPFNICIVIDLSGSTGGIFGGSVSVGDLNNDGTNNTILDAEISCVISLLESFTELGDDNVNVGLISFSNDAILLAPNPLLDPTDPSKVNPSLLNNLTTLVFGGGTYFGPPLDKSVEFFKNAPLNRSNIIYFLSDGDNGDGLDFENMFIELDSLQVKRIAIGVGIGSKVDETSALISIDNTPDPDNPNTNATQVLSPEDLNQTLLELPNSGEVLKFTLVVNDVVQNVNVANITNDATGSSFGPFYVGGLDPYNDNIVKVTIVIDADSFTNTTFDQVTETTFNEISG